MIKKSYLRFDCGKGNMKKILQVVKKRKETGPQTDLFGH